MSQSKEAKASRLRETWHGERMSESRPTDLEAWLKQQGSSSNRPKERTFIVAGMSEQGRHDGLNVDQISMNEGRILLATGSILIIVGCQQPTTTKKTTAIEKPIHIELDQKSPGESKGNLEKQHEKHEFRVGYGKNGVGCKGSKFQEGVTPLGKFKVNAILSKNKFLIDNSLVKISGRTKEYLKQNLFNNMSSIDFKGDGQTGEYGSGYISLTPVPATPQPFTFNTYDGKFRWYSFAIHGTNEESRIGKRVTGGCINMKNEDIDILIENINLGDEVVITSPQPCNHS